MNALTYLNNTTVCWALQALILWLFWLAKKYFYDKENDKGMLFVQLYLWWNIFSCFRGAFIAETYWDWKALVGNGMALLIPITAYAASNALIVQSSMSHYVKYALPLFAVFALLIPPDAYGMYLIPVAFLVLFFPVLTGRWKIIVFLIALIPLTACLGARSSVIKFGVPVLLLFAYYLRRFLGVGYLEWIRNLLFVAPVLFFFLAVRGDFNVFEMKQYAARPLVSVEKTPEGEIVERDLLADTRSDAYREVLNSAKNHNSWWIGRSPARGNDTDRYAAVADISGRQERPGNEAAILNIFSWTGIVGVLLYFFVFYVASYLAVKRSQSVFCKMLGIFIAFRWLYSWVEDINYFTLTTVFLWILLGLCLSTEFRKMNDQEVKVWVRGIFSSKYRRMQ